MEWFPGLKLLLRKLHFKHHISVFGGAMMAKGMPAIPGMPAMPGGMPAIPGGMPMPGMQMREVIAVFYQMNAVVA